MKSAPFLHSVSLNGADVIGTIDVTSENERSRSYLEHSQELLSGAPVSGLSVGDAADTQPMHAKHLAAELRNLNAQIDRMVCQVEDAICRLTARG